jgi:hypothetical protein
MMIYYTRSMEGMLFTSTQTFYERMLEHYTHDRKEQLPRMYEDMRRAHEQDQAEWTATATRARTSPLVMMTRRSMQYQPVPTDTHCQSV